MPAVHWRFLQKFSIRIFCPSRPQAGKGEQPNCSLSGRKIAVRPGLGGNPAHGLLASTGWNHGSETGNWGLVVALLLKDKGERGMPLYEFKCGACGVFEEWRAMAESSNPATCPTCQLPGKRIFSAVAVNLSSRLPAQRGRTEPELVKRDRDPAPQAFRGQTCGRPWMLNH